MSETFEAHARKYVATVKSPQDGAYILALAQGLDRATARIETLQKNGTELAEAVLAIPEPTMPELGWLDRIFGRLFGLRATP